MARPCIAYGAPIKTWAFLLPADHSRPRHASSETRIIMRTEQARPVRLADYQPPDWLVDTVELDVSLHPTATRVRAALQLKPNPDATAPAAVVLDGDGLTLASLKIDGIEMSADSYVA